MSQSTTHGHCVYHSGITEGIENLKERRAEDNIKNEAQHLAQWAAIDSMKNWVVAAMGSFIIGILLWILNSLHVIK